MKGTTPGSVADGVFAVLATAAFYFVEPKLEASDVPRNWALPISILVSGVGVGVLLRLLLTAVPLKIQVFRRARLPAAALEGMWLELLQRQGTQHYSIVSFKYDPQAQTDPFTMVGHSFYPSGVTHSEWGTRFMRIEATAGGFSVEYVYEVETPDHKGRPRRGYGESFFRAPPADPRCPAGGYGYYLAAEDEHPFRCPYRLQRIDEEFKILIKAQSEALKTLSSMQKLVRCAHLHYRTHSSPTDVSGEASV